MRDGVERVRVDLDLTGIATEFVGPTFTLAELRGGVRGRLGRASRRRDFRRSVCRVAAGKYFGADVTAVCRTKNVELARSFGADRVIDYTQEDFTKNGETYDFIFDAVGKHSFKRSKGSLRRGGKYLATDGFRNLLEIPGGHRSVLPDGGRDRGGEVRGNGAEDRERRPDDQRRLSSMRAIVRDSRLRGNTSE
ncbi:MAG TPA: zinc-binding dehydrogenase [Candidatus Dormibacteraeota bacterium]|nr:zinc-binding dehydrogenase [Candidatus Dormibacteraeota bacterium]